MRTQYGLLIFLFFCFAAFGQNFWDVENLPKPDHYIFGYGSLVNSESRLSTLDEERTVLAARLSPDFGYRRTWNFQGSGFTALGIEQTDQPMSINGVIIPVKENDIDVWDSREGGYYRVQVPWQHVQSVDWAKLPQSGKLWIYVPKNPKTPTARYPIIQSYLDVCMTGFLSYSKAQAIEFLETTQGWSCYWLNDRVMARRPWVHFKEHSQVDQLLKKHPKANNEFKHRVFISEWLLNAPA